MRQMATNKIFPTYGVLVRLYIISVFSCDFERIRKIRFELSIVEFTIIDSF